MLLGIGDADALLSHPIAGASWEGFVIESLVAAAPDGTEPSFFRTSAGAKIDLLLLLPGGPLWAIEIKRSLAPKVERGFHAACADLRPERRLVVYRESERFVLSSEIEAVPLQALARDLVALA